MALKQISNNTSGVCSWSSRFSKQLTEMLSTELKASGNVSRVERAGLNKCSTSRSLPRSKSHSRALRPKRGRMKGA